MVLAAVLLLLACVLLVRVAATPGQSASGWLAPETLTPPGANSEDAQVAIDARGNALAIWTRRSGDAYVLQAAERPAGGGWQQPVDVTPPRSIHGLQLSVTPSGDAVALWQDFVAGRNAAMSAARPAGGAWERAVRVSPGSRRASAAPARPRSARQRVRGLGRVGAGTRRRAGRRPPARRRLAPAHRPDPHPRRELERRRRHGRRGRRERRRDRDLDAGEQAPGARPPDLDERAGRGAAERRGLAAAGHALAWQPVRVRRRRGAGSEGQRRGGLDGRRPESSFATRVHAAARPAGGRWSRPARISAAGEAASEPQVEVDPRGEATVLWGRSLRQGFSIVRSSVRPAGGAWQAPVNVSPAGEQAGGGELAVDDRGNATAIWDRYTTFHEDTDQYDIVVRAATRSPGGAWQAPTDVSAAIGRNGDAQVAAGPNGPAIAIWEAVGDRAVAVQAAVRPG